MLKWIKEKIEKHNHKKIKKIVDNMAITALQTYKASTLNVFSLLKTSYKKKLLHKIETNKIWSRKKYDVIFKKIAKDCGVDYENCVEYVNYELLKGEYTQWCIKNIPQTKENQKKHTT